MRVPIEWLKEYVDVQASPEELAHRLTMAGLEVEAIEHDTGEPVLNVKVTPNRGDCLSMVGVAREVAALYALPLHHPMPAARTTEPGEAAQVAKVEILDDDLCPRYAARVVRNVRIAPSPAWMQQRLLAAGMRPINNVVDVTNYVMLELGQPLHAFDLDLLPNGRIVVRRARPGEKIVTLDGVERELHHAFEGGREVYVIWACRAQPSPFITGTATKVFRGTEELLDHFRQKRYIS